MNKRRFSERIFGFLFSPESDRWLAFLRFGLGLQVVTYSLSLRADWQALFAGEGSAFISRNLTDAILKIENPFVPQIGWFVNLGSQVGLGEQTTLSILWALLFSAGCCLLLGLFCRVSAITAWLLHLCAAKSGDFLAYGVDNLMTIGLFYLAIAPPPDRYALDLRLWKSKPKDPARLGFYRRVLQLHLCVIYFFSGMTKCLGAGWWNGDSIWRALTRPPFNIIPVEFLISWKVVFPVLGIAVCIIETSYPIFIWLRKTRLIWLVSVLAMHIGIGLSMGLYLFSMIMVVLNLAAFGPDFCFFLTQSARSFRLEDGRVEPGPSGAT